MAMKSLRKINTKLQFLYRQNEFLNPKLRRLLCNSLIQPHFDYAFISWYPLINQKMRNKLQVTQNKCICFYLKLNSRQHIGYKEFKKINWLPTKERVKQRIAAKAFNNWKLFIIVITIISIIIIIIIFIIILLFTIIIIIITTTITIITFRIICFYYQI